MLFRDVEHLIAAALLPWFFLTPILWRFAQLPADVQSHHTLLSVLRWGNPIAPPIYAVRDALWSGRRRAPPTSSISWSPRPLALALGAYVFTRVDDRIAVEL